MTVFFFTHIPFVVNHTIKAIPPERLHQYNGTKRMTLSCYFLCICHILDKKWVNS